MTRSVLPAKFVIYKDVHVTDENALSRNKGGIDLTDYSFLPNSLVSILTNFRITSADGNYIPMFSES